MKFFPYSFISFHINKIHSFFFFFLKGSIIRHIAEGALRVIFGALDNKLSRRKREAATARAKSCMQIWSCHDASGLYKYYFKEQNKICHSFS